MATFPDELKEFTEKQNEKFANKGLRCLYLAKATIDKDTFDEWHRQ
jgi:hypothetical protein